MKDWIQTYVAIRTGAIELYGLQDDTRPFTKDGSSHHPWCPAPLALAVTDLFAKSWPEVLSKLDLRAGFGAAFDQASGQYFSTGDLGPDDLNAPARRLFESVTDALSASAVAAIGGSVVGPGGREDYLTPIDCARFWDAWARVARDYQSASALADFTNDFWDAIPSLDEAKANLIAFANDAGDAAGRVGAVAGKAVGSAAAGAVTGTISELGIPLALGVGYVAWKVL